MKTLFLRSLTAFSSCIIITSLSQTHLANAQNLLDPKTQPQFVNPLPVPSVVDGRNGGTFTVSRMILRNSIFNNWSTCRDDSPIAALLLSGISCSGIDSKLFVSVRNKNDDDQKYEWLLS